MMPRKLWTDEGVRWIVDKKKCRHCKRRYPVSAFKPNPKTCDGLGSCCNRCERNRRLIKLFGITLAHYESLLKKQRGRCAICLSTRPTRHSTRFQNFSVDHDHNTGKIRGLLCNQCNRALGLFGDDAERLARALIYLQGDGGNLFPEKS